MKDRLEKAPFSKTKTKKQNHKKKRQRERERELTLLFKNKHMKTVLPIAKNETPKDRNAKEQPRAENAERIQGLQTTQLCTIFIWGVSLTHPVLALFVSGEFLLHIPCWLYFSVGSFSYTSLAGFIFIWGFLLHIPCWFHFYLGSFSYTSHASFIFLWVVSLTHPVLAFLLVWGVSLTHPVLFSSFIRGVSLTHSMLASFSCLFYLGSFSYTSHAGFIFIWGVYSCTSHAGFIFIWGVSLTHPMLVSFLSAEFLLHIPCWLLFPVFFIWGVSLTPRTPPLEGTSLHRRNISVERPWGILSLFTTCSPLWVKSSH